jgi:hypothetical protein
MLRNSLTVLGVAACLAAAPLAAQQQQTGQTPAPARATAHAPAVAGPRLSAEFPSYQPSIGKSANAAAASGTTTITISTVALVVLGIVLLLLLL